MLRDADFGPIRLRAFGTYALKATIPRRCLKNWSAPTGIVEADEVSELMRSIINSAFADMLGEQKNRRPRPGCKLPRDVRIAAEVRLRAGR